MAKSAIALTAAIFIVAGGILVLVNTRVLPDAIRAASHRHLFPSLTKEGAPAILETSGNPDCHLVLRGGTLPLKKSETPRYYPGTSPRKKTPD